MTTLEFFNAIHGARLVIFDDRTELLYVYQYGLIIQCYNKALQPVELFTFTDDESSMTKSVKKAIEYKINGVKP